LISGALCVFAFLFINSYIPALIATSLADFFVILSWSVIIMLTAEVYPTELKSTGSGWATGIGKVACILSPAAAGMIVHFT